MSLWPPRRMPLETRNVRHRRQPSIPGFEVDNLLVDDTNNDNYLIDDTNTDVHLLQDA